MKNTTIKKRKKIKTFDVINYTFFGILAVIMAYPIWHQFMLSLSDSYLSKSGGFFFWPRGFDLSGYSTVLTSRYIWVAFTNSLIITVAGVIFALIVNCGFGYFLSKKEIKGSKLFMILVLFTFLFNGGVIPTYIVVKETGLINSLWALIIPMLFNPYNVIIIRSFFSQLPKSLEESALIDGASYGTIFFRIVLPLSKPVLATIAIWTAVGQWNGYMHGLLYIHEKDKYILPLLIRDIIIGASDLANIEVTQVVNADIINAATIVIATIPILIVYPFLQKYFTKGIMLGSVKG